MLSGREAARRRSFEEVEVSLPSRHSR